MKKLLSGVNLIVKEGVGRCSIRYHGTERKDSFIELHITRYDIGVVIMINIPETSMIIRVS